MFTVRIMWSSYTECMQSLLIINQVVYIYLPLGYKPRRKQCIFIMTGNALIGKQLMFTVRIMWSSYTEWAICRVP